MAPKRATQDPCGVCNKQCKTQTILCETCEKWFHGKCQKLNNKDIKLMNNNDNAYICGRCRLSSDGYGYDAALERLTKAAKDDSMETLRAAVEMEAIYIRDVPLSTPTNDDRSLLRVDSSASALLKFCKLDAEKTGLPVDVSADGNCLYNALSVAVFNDESKTTEIRTRTCIEMVCGQSTYTKLAPEVLGVSPTYEIACLEASTNKGWASAISIAAAANVISRDIVSVYPRVNGECDKYAQYLTRTFKPRNTCEPAPPVTILWTFVGSRPRGAHWSPNHFVPIMEQRVANLVMVQAANLMNPCNPTEFGDVEYPTNRKLKFFDRTPPNPSANKKPLKMFKQLADSRGPELIHNKLQYGQFGLQAVTGGELMYGHLEMIRLTINRKMDEKTMFAVWRVEQPWKSVTKKGRGHRMGGGKGSISHYIYPVKANRIIVEMGGECYYEEVYKILKQIAKIMPFPSRVVNRMILEEEEQEMERIQRDNVNQFTFEYCVKNNMMGIDTKLSPYDHKWFGKYR